MRDRWSLPLLVILTVVTAHAAGPELKYKAPRTESGQPDLRGVWNFSSDVPLERPAAFADRKLFTREEIDQRRATMEKALQSIARVAPVEDVQVTWLDHAVHVDDLRTSLITYPENGRLPALVEGVRRLPSAQDVLAALADSGGGPPPAALAAFLGGGPKNGPEDFGASERCLFAMRVPILPDLDANYVQVLQNKDQIVLLTDSSRRTISVDSRPFVAGALRSWSGDSRGHWEHETLVVETRNFNSRTRSFAGAGTSEGKVVVERFTRSGANVLQYEATVTDPKTFQDKVTLSFPMASVDSRIHEWGCHEGNYSMANMLSAARAQEREASGTQAPQ
jgi:hypothetical protein